MSELKKYKLYFSFGRIWLDNIMDGSDQMELSEDSILYKRADVDAVLAERDAKIAALRNKAESLQCESVCLRDALNRLAEAAKAMDKALSWPWFDTRHVKISEAHANLRAALGESDGSKETNNETNSQPD